MRYVIAHLHILGIQLHARLKEKPMHDERGSVTAEVVLWALAVITLVGIVVAALTGFINAQVAKLG